jgi:histidinol dehydrogenase
MKGPRLWITPSLPSNWEERRRIVQSRPVRLLEKQVERIIEQVRAKGDSALVNYTRRFDKVTLDAKRLRITSDEVNESYRKVSEEEISAIESMKQRLEVLGNEILDRARFHMELNGVLVRNLLKPIESAGCYVPGGEAAYPSTLAMTVVPAKLAGVPRVVVCSPPTAKGTINPLTLVASDICGVDEVYKVGGVQAIAALAYGTRSINPVRKIVGPGNKYVTMAKILVSRHVPIDMPAGPSEIPSRARSRQCGRIDNHVEEARRGTSQHAE